MNKTLIAASFVEDALHCVHQRGFSVVPLLVAARIDQREGRVLEPVTVAQYGALWRGVASAVGDEFLGLGARPMRPGSFAMLCHSVLHTRRLEQALQRALEFLRLLLDQPYGELVQKDGVARIVLHDDDLQHSAFAYRTYWIIVHGLACWLVGRRIALHRVDFSGPEPKQGAAYRLLFSAPIHYGQAQSGIAFDASLLSLPVIRSESALRQFLRRAPANLLVRYQYDEGLVARVRQRLRSSIPCEWPALTVLAAELGIPSTTLRRRLREQGHSYRAIRDEIRHELAIATLTEGQDSIGTIAADLGFSEASGFHRAFRKWTSQSPGEFRRKRQHV